MFKSFFSIDEFRSSITGTALLLSVIVALIIACVKTDVPPNLLTLIQFLLGGFVGLNGIHTIKTTLNKEGKENENNSSTNI